MSVLLTRHVQMHFLFLFFLLLNKWKNRLHRHSSFLPPNFLRPVIGTFSAEGIGHDTADTSYRDRAISLSRQQVINEAKGAR